jgi:hypothetical protein
MQNAKCKVIKFKVFRNEVLSVELEIVSVE